MSLFTLSGRKLAVTALAAGALAVGGTGAIAVSSPGGPAAFVAENEPSASPTETETESPDPTPTDTETATPDPTPTETGDPTSPASVPVGPDATGPAAVGLCNAYAHGGLNETSTAFAALAEAAGGESGIEDYCATVPAPEDDADDTEAPEEAPEEETPTGQQGEERDGQVAGQGAPNGPQSDNAGKQSAGQPGRGQR